MLDKLADIERRYQELDKLMAQPDVAADFQRLQGLAKERASLEGLVSKYREYRRVSQELEQAQSMLQDGPDEEMVALIKQEVEALKERRSNLDRQIKEELLPRDPNDEKNVIVEIRAGTGGGEAALFAADLYRMYSRYAENQGFEVEVMDSNPTGIGGFKEIIFELRGKAAFSRLKYERGVHRVQRVPVTEASGRIHTSTATVAVLPEAEEVEAKIDSNDLRIDIFHAGGHGGQNVNKVATAVRITHIPTGLVAVCQDERSQLKNKTKAMTVLRARVLDREMRKQAEEITEERRSQVGSGERAEKVRTYNFPQNRVTDHRIGLTLHNLDRIMDGDLDELIEALVNQERAEKLEEALT